MLSSDGASLRKPFFFDLIQIKDHTPTVRELILESHENSKLNFKAGQFVMLHVPQKDTKPALRAYSIASSENESSRFHLLFKYVPKGIASEYVWSLKGNECLQFTGPFGKLFFKEPPSKQLIFFNTGTGLAQHYSYLISKLHLYPDHNFKMLFGLPNKSEIYYQKELSELKSKNKNFEYEYILSPTESKIDVASKAPEKYRTGFLQEFLHEYNYNEIPTTFYLCGNRQMLCAVRDQLQSQNFPKENVLCEAFD